MNCKCYEYRLTTKYDPCNFPEGQRKIYQGYCKGTKEVEPCKCEGNELNCDFYPEVREKAQKETLEYKIRNAIDLLKKNGYVVYKEV